MNAAIEGSYAVVEDAPMSDEQAADFARLNAGAAAADAPPMGGPSMGARTAETLSKEVLALAGLVVGMLSRAYPSIEAIYTPDVLGEGADRFSALCVKHGWLQGGFGGEYSEEIGFALWLLPMGYVTAQAVKADRQAAKARAEEGRREGSADADQ